VIKTLLVARREFVTTVFTKGFLLGVLMTPLMLLVVVGAIALTQNLKGPTVAGTLAIADRTEGSLVAQRVLDRMDPAAMEARRRDAIERFERLGQEQAQRLGVPAGQAAAAGAVAAQAADARLQKLAGVSARVLASDDDLEARKADLGRLDIRAAGRDGNAADPDRIIALAIIPDGAVRPGAGGSFERFELLTANRLDPEITDQLQRRVADAIVDARVAVDPALSAGGLTPERLRAVLDPPGARVVALTRDGEQKSAGVFHIMLPMGFMILLMIAVMTGGNYLLTTTIEEKSSRVMEVLLSAVSPMELMLGKIFGQMCVGLVILTVYSGMGVASLFAFAMQHQLDPMLLVYLVVFFFIAFFTIASLMAAVGSAVSELREAQSLMTPIMLLVMLPWLLWLPISRAPNSVFATILSFVPGISPFVMMLRLCGSEPPPVWHAPVAVLIGLITVAGCAWVAAKVFRVGVLMYGKPPNFATLVRWVRMA
jgi:ABC-type Na+ efflux pump permease subunit